MATKAQRTAWKSKAAGMSISVKAEGIDNAEQMIAFLHECGAAAIGAVLHGRKREGGKGTNADVIRYLAEGITRGGGMTGDPQETIIRDLGPTQSDADAARALYMAQVMKQIRKLTYRAAKGSTASRLLGKNRVRKIAESASSSGLRAGAKLVAEKMLHRAENQLTVHDGGESAAASVEQEHYAPRRQKLYGVGALSVYKATGQLLRNLGPGNVRMVRHPSWLKGVIGELSGGLKSAMRSSAGKFMP